jgi:hypothetical protein
MTIDPRRRGRRQWLGWRARPFFAAGLATLVMAGLGAPVQAGDLSDLVEQALEERRNRDDDDAAPRPGREEVARNWDAFLTAVIKRAGHDAPPGDLRDQLLGVLIDERHHVVTMLTDATVDGPELMRSVFESSWEQLSPLLQQVAAAMPEDDARRYAQFIEAGELMRAAERLGVARDLASSPESLRKLAEMLLGEEGQDPLHYDTAVDPELRRIFGFGEPLAPPSTSPLLGPVPQAPGAGLTPLAPLSALANWLVPQAWASPSPAGDRSTLVARLNTWIPGREQEVREYVPLVHDMLRLTVDDALGSAVAEEDATAAKVYPNLVIATAWQESCWRQFVRSKEGVQPLVSPAGSVGLMQINGRVWRGLYDPAGLEGDIGYNGRAGAEILWHYLRDFALPAGEHLGPGGADNLARATYAAYNGGPGHLSRYRKARTSSHLQVIDKEFWRKYEVVRKGEQTPMFSCYPTER